MNPLTMEPLELGRWRLRYDPDATRRAYWAVDKGDPETCGCSYCRNWAAARTGVYPAEFLDLVERLGIRPDREANISHLTRLDSGIHLYSGWFHFVGQIDAPIERSAEWEFAIEFPRFSFAFSASRDLAHAAMDGLPLVQLEFNAEAPWVLDEAQSP
jgi:hypothetical protein